jgi:hypothetical protein
MRRAVVLVASVFALAGCTGRVEEVTSALTPTPEASTGPTGPRLTEVVGDAIVVETPFPNDEVGSPVSITGTADVAGGEVTVRVLDGAGNELAQTIVEASCGDGCTGTFAAELYYFVPERTPGWVEVSGASAEVPAPRVRVPVILFP